MITSSYLSMVQMKCEVVVETLGFTGVLAVITTTLIFFSFFCRESRKLPPGPPALPIIGHLHLLGASPHKSMFKLSQKYGPLMFLRLGTKPTIVVSTSDMAKEIFKEHDLTFSHRPHMTVKDQLDQMNHGIAFTDNNSSWRNYRKILTTELLSSKRRLQVQKYRAEEISHMLKSILADTSVSSNAAIDLSPKIHIMALDLLSRMVLSRRFSSAKGLDNTVEVDEFKYVMTEVSMIAGQFVLGDYIPFLNWLDIGGWRKHAAAMHSRLQDILTTILNEHRAKRRENGDAHVDLDMVDWLLTHQEMEGEESITEEDVRGLTWEAFMAGTETVQVVVEWTVAHLLKNPRILNKLKAELDDVVGLQRKVTELDIPELKYLQAIFKETFRLHTPGPLLLPHASHDPCTVAGYHIPANTRLLVNSWAMGRDPGTWKQPLEFSPERFMEAPLQDIDPASGRSYELIPFGTGRRMCPAASYGLVTAQLAVASLVQGFEMSWPDEVGMDLRETESGIVTKVDAPLLVHLQPRLEAELY